MGESRQDTHICEAVYELGGEDEIEKISGHLGGVGNIESAAYKRPNAKGKSGN